MSAEGTQHRKGQLSPQPQTVFPPPLWEALQGPPFLDQQVQEQLLPCGCHPAEPCTTVMAPLVTPSHTFLYSPLYPGLTATHLPPATENLHEIVHCIYLFILNCCHIHIHRTYILSCLLPHL